MLPMIGLSRSVFARQRLFSQSVKMLIATLLGLLLAGLLPVTALLTLVSPDLPGPIAALSLQLRHWLPEPATVLAEDNATTAPTNLVAIGSRIWYEDDYDGDVSTGGIKPIGAGQVVRALASNGKTVYTGTTNAVGVYEILVPPHDTYTVTTGLPANMIDIPPRTNDGKNPVLNYNRNHNRFGTTVVITETANLSINFVFYPPIKLVSLGDRLWLEDDYDGDATTGTVTPIGAGHVVTALASDGVTTYTGVTDANGNYRVLIPEYDTYTVTTALPAGTLALPVIATHGNDSTSNNHNHDHLGTPINITYNDEVTLDFGFYPGPDLPPTVSLGNYVWFDSNGDGLQNEPPTAGRDGITVTLTYPSGMTASRVTSNGGYYTFTQLLPNHPYTLQFDLPVGYSLTTSNQGGNDTQDSDPARAGVVFVTLGSHDDFTIDAGIVASLPVVSLGDFVWEDINGNGRQELGEPGIPNAPVTLTLPNASKLTTATDGGGFYEFINLLPGTPYTVTFGIPAGYKPTLANVGSAALDSDGLLVKGLTSLILGTHDATIDSGFRRLRPALVLTKEMVTNPAQIQPGSLITYTLSYQNTGHSLAAGIVITETVSTHTTFAAGVSTPGWNCDDGAVAGSTCTFAVGDLLPDQAGIVIFGVKLDFGVLPGLTISNTASMSAADEQIHGVVPVSTDEATFVIAGPTTVPGTNEPGSGRYRFYLPITRR